MVIILWFRVLVCRNVLKVLIVAQRLDVSYGECNSDFLSSLETSAGNAYSTFADGIALTLENFSTRKISFRSQYTQDAKLHLSEMSGLASRSMAKMVWVTARRMSWAWDLSTCPFCKPNTPPQSYHVSRRSIPEKLV